MFNTANSACELQRAVNRLYFSSIKIVSSEYMYSLLCITVLVNCGALWWLKPPDLFVSPWTHLGINTQCTWLLLMFLLRLQEIYSWKKFQDPAGI